MTLAPAATAFLMRVWHWSRLCAMLEVEVSWPTACAEVNGLPKPSLGERRTTKGILNMFWIEVCCDG